MAPPTDVVVLIHGIRTYAIWAAEVRTCLEAEGFVVEPTNYMRFDVFRFLLPSQYFRRKAIDRVWTQIRDVIKQHPGKRISFIAHSFGTYVLSEILRHNFDFKADRIIFCGSIVRYDFPFEQIADRFDPPILNDIGTRDLWPAMAESITTGYGSAGTFGFRRPRVRDRWHNGKSHSSFLTSEFCQTFWIPFLRDKSVVEGDKVPESPPWWIALPNILKLKYGIAVLLVVISVAIAQRAFIGWASACAPVFLAAESSVELRCGLSNAAAHQTALDTLRKIQTDLETVHTSKDQTILPLLREYEREPNRAGWRRIKEVIASKLKLVIAASDAIEKLSVRLRTQVGPDIAELKRQGVDATLRRINAEVLNPRSMVLENILDAEEPPPAQVERWVTRLSELLKDLARDLEQLRLQLRDSPG